MKQILKAPSVYTGLLQTVFILMKIEGVIRWRWVWVLAFFWIPCAAAAFFYALFIGVCLWARFSRRAEEVRIALSLNDTRN